MKSIRRILVIAMLLFCSSLVAWGEVSGEIRWFDLVTEDAATANSFYSELFDWKIEQSPSGSFVAILDGRPIAGISQVEGSLPENDESTWIAAIIVADLPATVHKAEKLGAKVLEPITRVESYGSYAVIEDPQGAPVMLAITEQVLGGQKGPGAWVWAELWTDDMQASSRFYGAVIGYETSEVERPAGAYSVFRSQDEARAGLVEIQDDKIEPTWAPYIGVSDLAATIAHTRKLGGEVLLEPSESLGGGRIALLADPVGGAFFVFQLEGTDK